MTDDQTAGIEERLTESELSDLRAIRRASMAIRACAEILIEDSVNQECTPIHPGAYIALEGRQSMGLHYAVEACANRITGIFDDPLNDVGFSDEICADLTNEARQMADLQSGEISFSEYKKNMGLPDSLQ